MVCVTMGSISKRLVMMSIVVRAQSEYSQPPRNSITQGPIQSVATLDHGADLASQGANNPYCLEPRYMRWQILQRETCLQTSAKSME